MANRENAHQSVSTQNRPPNQAIWVPVAAARNATLQFATGISRPRQFFLQLATTDRKNHDTSRERN